MKRTVETNQRIYFDLDPSGRYLISGKRPTKSINYSSIGATFLCMFVT